MLPLSTSKWRNENAERIRQYKREWYRRNQSRVVGEVATRKRQLTDWFNQYKANLRCQECGEDHPACLDFHHRDASQKVIGVSLMTNYGWSVVKNDDGDRKVRCSVFKLPPQKALAGTLTNDSY